MSSKAPKRAADSNLQARILPCGTRGLKHDDDDDDEEEEEDDDDNDDDDDGGGHVWAVAFFREDLPTRRNVRFVRPHIKVPVGLA